MFETNELGQISTDGGVHHVEPGGSIEVARGTPVVCIPVYGAHDYFATCLRSVLEHTPPETPILIADDASPDRLTERWIDELAAGSSVDHAVYYLRHSENLGFVANVNSMFSVVAPGDVVLLNSDCEVGRDWLRELRAAAYSDSTVATATALTNHGTILSVPHRNRPVDRLPGDPSVTVVAAAVAEHSARLYPRIPTAVGHCVYVRRSALDLVGPFDIAFSPGYGEEVDFSQRCVLRGLVHVAADSVFVFHHGSGTFGTNGRREEHERLIAARYPYYHDTVDALERATAGSLPRSLVLARRAVEGLTVTIDARCLGPTITGTQIHVLELTHALVRTGRAALRLIVPPDMNEFFRASLASLDAVDLVRTDELPDLPSKTTIAHRPFQVFDERDLELLLQLGERIVITQQDLISYRNPGYSPSFLDWKEVRRVTREALALADRVLFFSQHAADDALRDDLVEPGRVSVALLGVDHNAAPGNPVPTRPRDLPPDVEAGDGFLLCLGTNFRHKNRMFALALLSELHERHDWQGWLVFAGPHASSGTSKGDESAYLTAHPAARRRTIDLRSVPEPEKAWLLTNARGVVYPSLYEGFGLVPFEAADFDVPCFFAAQTALTEVLPLDAATIVQWDAKETAERIAAVLRDDEARGSLIGKVRTAGSKLTWDRTAATVIAAYEEAIEGRQRDLVLLWDGDASPTVLAAGGLDASVPVAVNRAFRALARRRWLRAPIFGLLRAGYAAGFMLKHGRRPAHP